MTSKPFPVFHAGRHYRVWLSANGRTTEIRIQRYREWRMHWHSWRGGWMDPIDRAVAHKAIEQFAGASPAMPRMLA